MKIKIKTKPLPKKRSECFEEGYEAGAIAVTQLLGDHPGNWDGPCVCEECMSDGSN